MQLAASSRKEFVGRLGRISIFDSREAWRQFEGGPAAFSEAELQRHWLCSVTPRMIDWIAKGRSY
jgi:hypothetical protein